MEKTDSVIQTDWGYELVWSTNELYCGKILVFDKIESKIRMQFHKEKDKTWFINNGQFILTWIDTATGTTHTQNLAEGSTWRVKPLVPHQLQSVVIGSSVTEVSNTNLQDDLHYI